ncbi:hypothetical protein HCU01_16420 [Halomonas cupida]|uniref:HTH domain-containing protein n=3 Tax=Halomonas cupida TaxID=44933 RepID=A0ABQ0WGI1_9GAMM|nr:hypothetical protein HCU01_16420 [Halomonas cupida]
MLTGSNNSGGISMDALIMAAAQSLEAGDPISALNRVALRNDAHALALRGIAMAQLGDLARARELLQAAARTFANDEVVERARCIVAEAEIALVSRDLGWSARALDEAREALEAYGDQRNAAHARYLEARLLLLTGRLDDAESLLATLDPDHLPPASRAARELVVAGIAMRRRHAQPARRAFARAEAVAHQIRIPALTMEVASAAHTLDAPVAHLITEGGECPLLLEELEALETSSTLVVDACRHVVRDVHHEISLATRPVLFALARSLSEAWPGDVRRDTLISRAFKTQYADDTHRARLRVEIGRLRAELRGLAEITSTHQGFVLVPQQAATVATLVPPIEDRHNGVLALLADGEAWSSSALAMALGVSQRTVQRSLDTLHAADKVTAHGQGRARRWAILPVPGFPTTLLLPVPYSD